MKIKNILSSITAGMLATCAKEISKSYTESMEEEQGLLLADIARLETAVNADRCNKTLQDLEERVLPDINKMLTVLKMCGQQNASDAKARSISHFISLKRPRELNWGRFRTFLSGLVAMPAPSDRLASLLHSKLSQQFETLDAKMGLLFGEEKTNRKQGTCDAPRKAIVENIWTAYNLALLGTGDNDAAVASLIETIEAVCLKAKQTLTHGGSGDEEKEEDEKVDEVENVSGEEEGDDGDENNGVEGVLGGNGAKPAGKNTGESEEEKNEEVDGGEVDEEKSGGE